MTPLPTSVRLIVAKDPGASERLLRRLVSDPDPAVRAAAAANPKAPPGLDWRLVAVQRPLSRAEFPDYFEGECGTCGLLFQERPWFPLDHECPYCGSDHIDYREEWEWVSDG